MCLIIGQNMNMHRILNMNLPDGDVQGKDGENVLAWRCVCVLTLMNG